MQEMHSYEYAVIRCVPQVEREEFINVGVVLYCKKFSFLKAITLLDEKRLEALFPDANYDDIKSYLLAFEQICLGNKNAGPIAKLDMAVRFRWLTAKRSTIVQTSPVHSGLCNNQESRLAKLFKDLVQQ